MEQKEGSGIFGFMGDCPRSQSQLCEMAIPLRTHPSRNTKMAGDWLLKTKIWKHVLSLYCTLITSGREHREDTEGIRSAIHSVFV